MTTFIIYTLISLNILSFILYGIDKFKAKKGYWRISEFTLLIFTLLGAVGAFLGMKFFRHKTQKWKFKILVPLFLILQVGALLYILYNVEF